MAFYGQQRKMAEGQFTQTIYGLIRDQKFAEAIQHLNIELQVGKALQNPFHIRMSLLPRSLLRAHPMLHCSNSPNKCKTLHEACAALSPIHACTHEHGSLPIRAPFPPLTTPPTPKSAPHSLSSPLPSPCMPMHPLRAPPRTVPHCPSWATAATTAGSLSSPSRCEDMRKHGQRGGDWGGHIMSRLEGGLRVNVWGTGGGWESGLRVNVGGGALLEGGGGVSPSVVRS